MNIQWEVVFINLLISPSQMTWGLTFILPFLIIISLEYQLGEKISHFTYFFFLNE
jgi:hypothetical protein